MAKKEEQSIVVTQTRSVIGRPKSQRGTLAALGLGRIGNSRVHQVSPEILGMLRKVSHLIDITEGRK